MEWFPTLAGKTNTRCPDPDPTQRVPRCPGAQVGHPGHLFGKGAETAP
jgi:hypothetical protein